MSQHSSLKVSSVGARHRNVLKRHERIKRLKEMEIWKDRGSALRLPKIKSMKIKVKKTKSEKAGEAAPGQTPVAGQPAALAQTQAAKPAAKGK